MVKIDEEYIKEWLVLGPFFPDDLEKDFLAEVGGEANIIPKEGDTITTSDSRTLTWKQYSSKTNIISLLDAIGYHESATAYAFCVLQSDVADDFQVYLGYTDGIMVWINGELVYSSPVGEIFDVEEYILSPPIDKYLAKANLKAGPNHCLIKVTKFNRIGGDWEFAMRVLPPECAVISGIIADENGEPISNADVRLEQEGKRIAQTTTNTSGSYQLGIYPVVGQYDLCATSNEKGVWRLGIKPGRGEQQKLNLELREAINIEGSLLMLDNATPHVSVVVQAVTPVSDGEEEPKVIATTLSDENGRYRFVNLKPGKYQVCCQVLDGYVYYQDVSYALRFTFYGSEAKEENSGDILSVEQGRKLKNIDFRFPPFKKGNWRNYTYFDGLAHTGVNAICRAPDGMMWFATGGGVSRYNGKDFLNFTTKDGLADNYVNASHCSPDGMMWFATNGGISRYDGKDFLNFTTKDGLSGNYLSAIHCSPDGAMWFGTVYQGVSRYDGKKFVKITTEDGLANNTVFTMHSDQDGVMWFGTRGHGVSRYDGKRFINFTPKDGLVDGAVDSIYRDLDGVMWFGTWGGVSRYDENEFINITTKDGLASNDIWAIHRDPDRVMWFGTWGGGVSRYDGLSAINFTKRDGLPNNRVLSIHRNVDGTFWFGTDFGGVCRYDGKNFINFTTKDGLAGDCVFDIQRDLNGVLWFGVIGGLSRYDGKTFTSFTERDGLPN
ncbi:carboxypeptidase regulatory-like domain-containing protein, partial [bacterium]|nr:carboxypeptidase regulatory-like domain-containing protein [bacterium]